MLNIRSQNKIKRVAAAMQLDKPLRFSFTPAGSNPDTGCWSFQNDEHIIKLNLDCPSTKTRKTASATQYALAILEHEKAHAVYTERDFVQANDMCRTAAAPFLLFNLFEDARIEFIRREAGEPPLRWIKFDRIIMPTNPLAAMFSCMQREFRGSDLYPDLMRAPLYVDQIGVGRPIHSFNRGPALRWLRKIVRGGMDWSIARVVWDFYVEIVNSKSSFDLEPLLKRWMELFPYTSNRNLGDAGHGTVHGGTLPAEIADAMTDSPAGVQGTDAVGQGGGAPTGKPPNKRHHYSDAFSATELAVGNTLATMMNRMFKLDGKNRVATANPSKRLNLRGLARGDYEKPYRRLQTVRRGVPHVSLVVDLSVSMKGVPERNARCLLLAVNELAKQGVIRCTAYATADGGCQQSVDLPASPSTFNWQAYSGSEGMNTFFGQKSAALATSDLVVFVTDGQIGDKGQYLKSLHQKSVFVIGAYASDDVDQLKVATEMCGQLFDKIAVTKDLPNLAHRIGQLIAERI